MRSKFLLLGVGFGLCFPIIGLVSDCFIFNDFPFSFESMVNRISENPIHFIILSAPIVLGITFYFIGKASENRERMNKELAKSNAQIKVNNDLLDTFNYHVSHDLKTVLSNQLVLSKMLMKYVGLGELEKANEIAEKLVESGTNGLVTVKNFLKISQEGFASATEAAENINIRSEIERVLEDNGLKDDVMVHILEEEFTELKINEKVFESIILNLITNSIKYCDSEPEIKISLKKNQKVKHLILEDNGIGIDLNKNGEKLFAPFNRIENNKKTEGNGIGLYLVLKMMNSLGGKIDVESQLGKGTRFILTFFL